MKAKKKKVWLLLGYYEHDIFRGIMSFSRQAKWQLYRPLIFRQGEVPDFLGEVDGIISLHAEVPEIINIIRQANVPVVDMGSDIGLDVVRTYTDDYEIGRMTARYFIENGFRNLYYLWSGYSDVHSVPRWQGFSFEAEKSGRNAKMLKTDHTDDYFDWLALELQKFDFPSAVMCNSDHEADQLINCCLQQGISVPQQVAVVGVKSEDIIGESAIVPISCVDANCFELGYRSAELLDSLMNGGERPNETLLIKPKEVVVRQSSDVMAISHPQVLVAMKFISENYMMPINVEDVVRHVSISQRQLNKLFKHYLGHSILNELTRHRVDKAKRLLRESDERIKDIALECGFASSHRMNVVFHRVEGVSPREFRKQV